MEFRQKMGLGFILITSTLVIACNRSPESKAQLVVQKIESQLDLNEAQKSDLKKLKEEAIADIQSLKSERDVIADEIQKQLEKGKLDRELLKKIAAQERAKRAPLTEKWIDNVVTFHEGLTPKQKEQVLKDVKTLRKELRE